MYKRKLFSIVIVIIVILLSVVIKSNNVRCANIQVLDDIAVRGRLLANFIHIVRLTFLHNTHTHTPAHIGKQSIVIILQQCIVPTTQYVYTGCCRYHIGRNKNKQVYIDTQGIYKINLIGTKILRIFMEVFCNLF